MHEHDHPHGRTLAADLQRLTASRRGTLRWLASAVLAGATPLALLACGGGGATADDSFTSGDSDTSTDTSGGDTTTGSSSDGSCSVIPSETAGPYPGDGSQASGVNALVLSGIVRSDIRSSVGTASGTADGVPLTVTLRLVDTGNSCAALEGYAVYLWHCTRDGNYSMYSSGYTGENFLRGVQETDANGEVTFTTIFPGCYSGRWPHIHFEVYDSVDAATDSSSIGDHVKVSQLALPAAACDEVYGTADGYEASVRSFAAISLASDNVFGDDGAALQLASVSGDVDGGYVATLEVGIEA